MAAVAAPCTSRADDCGLGSARIEFPQTFPDLNRLESGQHNWPDARGMREFTADGSYERELAPGFIEDLGTLGPEDVLVDAGVGAGRATLEYLRTFKIPARVIAISTQVSSEQKYLRELFRSVSPDRVWPMLNQRVEDAYGIPGSSVRLIVDVYGPGAYTGQLDVVINQYLRWLKVGGKAYLTLARGTAVLLPTERSRRKYPVIGPMITETVLAPYALEAAFNRGHGFRAMIQREPGRERIVLTKLAEGAAMDPLRLVRRQINRGPPYRKYVPAGPGHDQRSGSKAFPVATDRAAPVP